MLRPMRVVVPKPEPEMERAEVEVVALPAIVVVDRKRSPPALRKVHCAIPPPAERASCGAVEEARVREYIAVVEVPMAREEVVAEKLGTLAPPRMA